MLLNETQLKNNILDWLKYNKIFSWLNNTQGNYNSKTNSYYKNNRLLAGVADIICLHKGLSIFIECKIGKNKQTAMQILFQKNVEKNGGIYLLIYKLDDVINFFKNK